MGRGRTGGFFPVSGLEWGKRGAPLARRGLYQYLVSEFRSVKWNFPRSRPFLFPFSYIVPPEKVGDDAHKSFPAIDYKNLRALYFDNSKAYYEPFRLCTDESKKQYIVNVLDGSIPQPSYINFWYQKRERDANKYANKDTNKYENKYESTGIHSKKSKKSEQLNALAQGDATLWRPLICSSVSHSGVGLPCYAEFLEQRRQAKYEQAKLSPHNDHLQNNSQNNRQNNRRNNRQNNSDQTGSHLSEQIPAQVSAAIPTPPHLPSHLFEIADSIECSEPTGYDDSSLAEHLLSQPYELGTNEKLYALTQKAPTFKPNMDKSAQRTANLFNQFRTPEGFRAADPSTRAKFEYLSQRFNIFPYLDKNLSNVFALKGSDVRYCASQYRPGITRHFKWLRHKIRIVRSRASFRPRLNEFRQKSL